MPNTLQSNSVEVDVDVVWAKSARGVCCLGCVFGGRLCFTRHICEEKWIPKDLAPAEKLVPAPKVRANPAPRHSGLLA